jgi:hypothetical protein
MCVYKFIEQNQNNIESLDGNLKDEGVITVYENGKLRYYSIVDERVTGYK